MQRRTPFLTGLRATVSTTSIAAVVFVVLFLVAVRMEVHDVATREEEILSDRFSEPAATVFVRAEQAELDLHARSAALVDVETGELLFTRAGEQPRAAASLTKLATMYAVLNEVDSGAWSLDDRLTPPPESYWSAMPARSSVLFLGPDQSVSVHTLLLGLSVASGNDAATALALHLDGSIESFAVRMNESVDSAGGRDHTFVEPSGIDRRNSITAVGFARFLVHYLNRFPEVTERYHSVEALDFPTSDIYGGRFVPASVTHPNRNLLLHEYPGADGLKTGYTVSAGYNLAATAERKGRRLVAVVLGVEASNHTSGSRKRTDDAAKLLDYGFDEYTRLEPGYPDLEPVRVVGGTTDSVQPSAAGNAILLPRSRLSGITGEIEQVTRLPAPVRRGDRLGTIRYFLDGEVLSVVPIEAVSGSEVASGAGAFFVRLLARLRPVR